MKRIILALLLILGAWTASAQARLDGTWVYADNKKEDIQKEEATGGLRVVMSIAFRFNGAAFDQSMLVRMDMDVQGKKKDGEEIDAVFKLSVSGSVSGSLLREGDRLTLTPADKPVIEVDSDIRGVPGGNMVKGMMTSGLKKELTKELKEKQEFTIISLSDTQLTLKSESKGKGEKAQEFTFKRK